MTQERTIIFVCEHGAAKSIVAAANFNRLANEIGLRMRALARGTNPDNDLSEQTIMGLYKDGLKPTEGVPRKLSQHDIQSAEIIVTFCELPEEYEAQAVVERWDGFPAISENYDKARDVIIERLNALIKKKRSAK
jgi:arsenate reductase (thioredoxin)